MEHDNREHQEIQDVQKLLKYAGRFEHWKNREHEARWIRLAQSEVPYVRDEARTVIVDKNLKLVIKRARKFINQGLPFEDLIQEGVDGLLHSVDLFDLSRGFKLSTYATWWIEQRIRRALENKSKLVKIPSNRLQEVVKLKKFYAKFQEEEGRPPTSTEIGKALGITAAKAEELGRLVAPHVSLDTKIGDDDNLPMIDYVVDEKLLPEDKVEYMADKSYALELIDLLEKEDRDFIKLKFGFLDDRQRTYKEMASVLQVTPKEAKDWETRILNELKASANKDKVNTPVLTDLMLREIGPNRLEVVMKIKKLTGWNFNQIDCFARSLPARLFTKQSQHLMELYKNDLDSLGAVVTILISA